MRLTNTIVFAVLQLIMLCSCGCSSPRGVSDSSLQTEEVAPAGVIDYPIYIGSVLEIYAKLTGAHLVIDEEVRKILSPVFYPQKKPPMTETQARDFIELGLHKAGVTVTRLDDNNVVLKIQR